MSRRPAFDPARLDDDLDQLLPPPAPVPVAPPEPAPADEPIRPARPATPDAGPGAEPAGSPQPDDTARDDTPARPARGGGGRTARRPRDSDDEAGLVAAVRIPKPLYDAVVLELLAGSVERPSYAQIVAWTCEDHPDDVLAELEHHVAAASRAPRGRKLATEVVPLTLRFQPAERRGLDSLIAQASRTRPITRTAAVIAALRVAVKHGLAPTDAGERP